MAASDSGGQPALRPLFTLRGHTAEVAAVSFFCPRSSAASFSSSAPSSSLSGPAASSASSWSSSWSPPQLLASGDVAGVVRVWNLASRRVVSPASFAPHAPRGVLQVQFATPPRHFSAASSSSCSSSNSSAQLLTQVCCSCFCDVRGVRHRCRSSALCYCC
jgi:WD40 repeat protein